MTNSITTAKLYEILMRTTLNTWVASGTDDIAALSLSLKAIRHDLLSTSVGTLYGNFLFQDGSVYDGKHDIALVSRA